MGKIADIIKENLLRENRGNEAYIIYGEMFNKVEKEVIELIEKCMPPMDCNNCRKNNESYFVACAMCEWIHDEFKQNLAKLKED